jgi:uncharacterized protein (TIGR03437 family)
VIYPCSSVHPRLLIFAALTAANCAQLSLPTTTAPPATSLLLPVAFASQSASVSGIQFDLQYDISALSLTATVGDAARTSGKTLYFEDLAPGQRRFVIVGLNQDSFVDGTLINLFASVSSNAAGGTYPLKLLNVVATDPSAQAVTINPVAGGITVQGTAGSGSRLQPEGVLNGASLLPGPVAPGEIITLLGAGIGPSSPQQPSQSPTSTALNGTSVLFDGTPTPLLYAAPNQVNAIAPYALQNEASTQVQITQAGQPVAQLLISVVASAPAIFTVDGSGVGPGAILNQDNTQNSPSNPAEKGSVVMLFATGAGQTNPPGADGQITGSILPKPLLPVSVQIGGLEARVVYAGAAPGMVAGILQVNCVVPMEAPSGYAVPILLSVGKTSSQAGVTLAIHEPEPRKDHQYPSGKPIP